MLLPASSALVIFEAKRDWLTDHNPVSAVRLTHPQIRVGRPASPSQASAALAETQLPEKIEGIPVVHLPWGDILADITAARAISRGRERIWLEELHTYLTEVIRMRTVADSMVYSVVLNEYCPGGDGTPTFREFVTHQLPHRPFLRCRGMAHRPAELHGVPLGRGTGRPSTESCRPMSSRRSATGIPTSQKVRQRPTARRIRPRPQNAAAGAHPKWRRHLPVLPVLGPA